LPNLGKKLILVSKIYMGGDYSPIFLPIRAIVGITAAIESNVSKNPSVAAIMTIAVVKNECQPYK